MNRVRGGACALLFAALGACATPGQVRRVETQVAILDRDHARADSARAVELARIQATLRQNTDSINLLIRELNENVQRVARDNASNFDNLRQQMYQLATATNVTQSRVARLNSQIETAVSSAPAVSGGDTARSGVVVPPADALLEQAVSLINSSAYSNARIALNTLLQNYPRSPQVADAVYFMGTTFDPAQPDSAKVYYTRAWKSYPDSPHAVTALFKLSKIEERAGNMAGARAYWQQIVSNDKYRNTDEYQLAQTRLRDNP